MKSLFQTSAFIALLSCSSVFAQQTSIDSPHNYKRPVSQQSSQPSNRFTVVPKNQVSYKQQQPINSLHHYKKQHNQNFASESKLSFKTQSGVLNPMNPVLVPNHYKFHFRPSTTQLLVATEFAKKDTTSHLSK